MKPTHIHTALRYTALIVLGLLCQTTATATGIKLAKSNNCMTCHGVNQRILGPSFKEIAARYKGKDVETKLAQHIRKGSSGQWENGGTMPPNPQVSAENAKALSKWILSQ